MPESFLVCVQNICLPCACTGNWSKFSLSDAWTLGSFCGPWAYTAPAGSSELSLDYGSHGNYRETLMGPMPTSYVRAIELQLQQAGAHCRGWAVPLPLAGKAGLQGGSQPMAGGKTWQYSGWPVATAWLLRSVLCSYCNSHICNCMSFLHLNTSDWISLI